MVFCDYIEFPRKSAKKAYNRSTQSLPTPVFSHTILNFIRIPSWEHFSTSSYYEGVGSLQHPARMHMYRFKLLNPLAYLQKQETVLCLEKQILNTRKLDNYNPIKKYLLVLVLLS